ncbi:MAG: hypothetical protein Q9167_005042 [Letrouitia subvulpina]
MAPTTEPPEAYMLTRDEQESQRLDAQHEYMRQLSHGHLVHPSIPTHQLHAVADVATGTGVWLRQLANDPALPKPADDRIQRFVGFDISPQQFPPRESLLPHITFVVHDIVNPFPPEYHEKFDLVNVRLVSYAIRAVHLDKVVQNILQILRPGGYLQWQETDACDSWAHPESPAATSCVNYVIQEKVDRGLLPGFAGPLVKTILSHEAPLADGQQNPISWSRNLMRLQHLETLSTLNHPSPTVEAGKRTQVITVGTALLKARLARKTAELNSTSKPSLEAEGLAEEIQTMRSVLTAIQSGPESGESWDYDVTWVVARKAIVLDSTEGWMSLRHPTQ